MKRKRSETVDAIVRDVVVCARCPRLVAYRRRVAEEPPRRHRGEAYWARPVPSFGDPEARLIVLGLAPAAHGGNRTGRIFTGDSSGDTLFAALHRAGFANQPTSVSRDDGLALRDVWITAGVRCAPPDNRPLPEEARRCRPFLLRELAALTRARVILALGGFAWESALKASEERGVALPRPLPRFGHGAEARLEALTLLGSYHVSRQNTNTGRLTAEMLDVVLARAKRLLEGT